MSIYEKDGRWFVVVEGGNGNPIQKSFASFGRAKAWETRRAANSHKLKEKPELLMDPNQVTLEELLERYSREITPAKKGRDAETYRIAKMLRHPLVTLTVSELTTRHLVEYRDERLVTVSASAVRSELSLIRRAIEVARQEWGCDLPKNPAKTLSLPPPGPARNRRLLVDEYQKLKAAMAHHAVAWSVVKFAIETGMRRGEILALKWRNIDLGWCTAHIPLTKNGRARTVPLTDGAVEVLRALPPRGENVFTIDDSALRWAFCKAQSLTGIKGLRFHDLRHEAISRLFEMGLTVPEVQMISGHKTIGCLFRYTHLLPLDLAQKLRGLKPRTLYEPDAAMAASKKKGQR